MEKLLLFQIGHVPNDDCRSERIDNCVRLVVNDEPVVDLTAEADDRVQSKWLRHLFSGLSFSPKVATSETPFRKRHGVLLAPVAGKCVARDFVPRVNGCVVGRLLGVLSSSRGPSGPREQASAARRPFQTFGLN